MITAHDPYQTVNHPHQLPLPLPLDAESEALCEGFRAGFHTGSKATRWPSDRVVMAALKEFQRQ